VDPSVAEMIELIGMAADVIFSFWPGPSRIKMDIYIYIYRRIEKYNVRRRRRWRVMYQNSEEADGQSRKSIYISKEQTEDKDPPR
jgi:hypothetical protein